MTTLYAIDAMHMARRLHRDQFRWYGEPYWLHPERVATAVGNSPEYNAADLETKEAMLVVAHLHDAVEDTDYSLAQAEVDFGPVVRAALDSVTHRKDELYADYVHRAKVNPIGRVVKRADIADNLSTLPFDKDRSWYKYIGGLEILSS